MSCLSISIYLSAVLLAACAHSDSDAPLTSFDGVWQNSSLGYDLDLLGALGIALRPRSPSMQDGDPVFRMMATDGSSFTGRLWMEDGGWHTVTGEKKQDGTLEVREGSKSWTLRQVKN
jgi:hypothetical protein